MTEILLIIISFFISSISWFFIHRFSIMAQLENQMEVMLFNDEIQSNYCYSVIDSYSALYPRKCESCHKKHNFYQYNSFFSLFNKCNKRNTIILLMSEIILFSFIYIFYLKFKISYFFVLFLILIFFFFMITIIDFKYYIIPDELNYLGLTLGLIIHTSLSLAVHFQFITNSSFFNISSQNYGFVFSISGIVLSSGILFAIAHLTSTILNKEAMGGGDIKLIAFIGAFLGYKTTLIALAISSLLGSIFGLFSLVKSKLIQKNQGYTLIAYGPYIIFASLIVMYFGDQYLFDLYSDFSIYWVNQYINR